MREHLHLDICFNDKSTRIDYSVVRHDGMQVRTGHVTQKGGSEPTSQLLAALLLAVEDTLAIARPELPF